MQMLYNDPSVDQFQDLYAKKTKIMTDRHFHPLRIAKIIKRTELASSLEFEVPDNLQELYRFKAGQYLTFKVNHNGQELRRSYSINSSEYNSDPLQVTVKKVAQGKVSNHFVDDLQVNDILEVMPPLGQFVLPDAVPDKVYLYAAGSGVTPIFGILKTLLQGHENCQVNMQYGNFNREQVIFHEELQALENAYSERFVLTHHYTDAKTTESKGLFGKFFGNKQVETHDTEAQPGDFTVDKLLKLAQTDTNFNQAHHYICGPGQMIPELEAALLSIGVSESNIHHEYFAAADAASSATRDEVSANNNSETSDLLTTQLTVTLDGDTETFDLPAGETVLRASIDEGLSVPYACESGVCATCKALCKKGKVKLRSNAVLSDDELEQGYILTCQAEALTAELEVDYDAV